VAIEVKSLDSAWGAEILGEACSIEDGLLRRDPQAGRRQEADYARADLDRSQQETRRVQLLLRQRASEVLQAYQNSREAVDRYHGKMIPRAPKAYQAMLARWGQMAASYPQTLLAQRTLFELQRNYITALEDLWTSSIALRGLLLTDGLEAPARPSEVDRPIREINLPFAGVTPSRER
jgi:Outer membrane efflux protein